MIHLRRIFSIKKIKNYQTIIIKYKDKTIKNELTTRAVIKYHVQKDSSEKITLLVVNKNVYKFEETQQKAFYLQLYSEEKVINFYDSRSIIPGVASFFLFKIENSRSLLVSDSFSLFSIENKCSYCYQSHDNK